MHINWQRTRDILICAICIGIIIWASWLVMGQFVEAIVMLLLSMAIAFLLSPTVDWLASMIVILPQIMRELARLFNKYLLRPAMKWLASKILSAMSRKPASSLNRYQPNPASKWLEGRRDNLASLLKRAMTELDSYSLGNEAQVGDPSQLGPLLRDLFRLRHKAQASDPSQQASPNENDHSQEKPDSGNKMLPRLLATFLVYIVVLGALGWLGYLLVSDLIDQVHIFSNTIIQVASHVPQNYKVTIDFLEKRGHIPEKNINDAINQLESQANTFATSLATNAVNLFFVISGAFLGILEVIVLSFYLTLDGKRIRRSLFSIVPKSLRPSVSIFDKALSRVVGNYIRGQLTLAIIVGMATSFFCIFTDLQQYALICGVLAFLFETIPMIGPGLASITPIILSLLLLHPLTQTLILVACFVGLQIVESNILGPRIVGHAVGLHPVAAILSLIVGTRLFGLVGALIATPIVAAGWVVIASIYRSAKGETPEQILARKPTDWTRPLSILGGSQGTSGEENPENDTQDVNDQLITEEPV